MITATMTPGETQHFDGYDLTPLGELKMGRSTYKIQVQTIFDERGATEDLQLVGPRGALYWLRETNRPGVYQPIGLMSGPMIRKGNPVYVTVLGNLMEVTTS